MRSLILSCFLLLTISLTASNTPLKKDFVMGDPGVKSINSLAFGPEGILFVGDSESAEIHAIDLNDHAAADNSKVNLSKVDMKIADAIGSSVDELQIIDMAVNTSNGNIYFAVQHSSDQPILLRLNGENFENVNITSVSHSNVSLNKAIAADAKDRRGRSQRKWAVSDLAYSNGKVMVSGLSSEEFGSTFRMIDFPFTGNQMHSSLEIYHAAHGQYETHSPIKSFAPVTIGGKPAMVAGYTCTPLVVFPLDELKPGEHTKGRTVAELGNRNTPLDIISFEKEGENYILMANSSRALMKINIKDIEKFEGSLDTPVKGSATSGIDFINLPMVNVQQIANLDSENILMLQRDAKGSLNLKVQTTRWL